MNTAAPTDGLIILATKGTKTSKPSTCCTSPPMAGS
jgi:hypothetical protein